ncbi:competence type IV pilus major pilin ComGC [Evansella clarkii]|uniref:competence type IV pilus major pilin ComGC n=1 Tax=Evansella clarkii TaxID=79879 RepID=UPI000B4361A7|nr:competence type IV pilus major pilin ComGC [Evansella clarkii]
MKKIKSLINKGLRNEKGFTLIEMMIVLIIISILLLIAVPNLAKNQSMATEKGCEATKDLIKAQYFAYEIDTGNKPESLSVLEDQKYVDTLKCPDGSTVTLNDLGL